MSKPQKYYWFSEQLVFQRLSNLILQTKDYRKYNQFSVKEDDLIYSEKPTREVICKIFEFYNETSPYEISNQGHIIERMKRWTQWLSNHQTYPTQILSVYYDLCGYAVNSFGKDIERREQFALITRLLLYLPVMVQQIKKQKLITGFHSETNQYIYSTMMVRLPTNEEIKASDKLRFMLGTGTPQKELSSLINQYFLGPLSYIVWLFNESDQDMLPSIWGHPVLHANRNIPDTGERWQDTLDACSHKQYSLPREGVLVQCKNYGDIEMITLKEAGNWIYAKISFSDQTEDIVILDPVEKIPITSGYATAFDEENDLVVKVVAKAYTNLVTAKRVSYRNPVRNWIERNVLIREANTQTTSNFVYIPRTVYEGRRVSGVRQKSTKGTTSVPHMVVGHLRRGNPSENAKVEAKKYGIHLPDGYTFVRPYQKGTGTTKQTTYILT